MSINLSEVYDFIIFDQKNTMMCVATSVLTAIEYLQQVKGYPFKHYSRRFTYFFGRIEYNKPKQNTGLKIEYVIKSLEDYGLIQQRFINDDLNHLNSDIENFSSIQEMVSSLELEINVNLFKLKLNEHIPIICILYCTFDELCPVPKIIETRKKSGNKTSHCVCIIGYDDNEEVLIFQNSQGINWQFNGFGKIRYNAINKIVKAVCIENIIELPSEEINI